MRVTVIGGGVVGLCLAHELRRGGAEVVVVEADRCGAGCSSANAGWLSPSLSAPLAAPDVLRQVAGMLLRPATSPVSLRPRLGAGFPSWAAWFLRSTTARRHAAGQAATLALGASAAADYGALRDDGVAFEMHRAGLIAGVASAQSLDRHAESFLALRRDGYVGRIEVLDGPALRRREPAFGDDVVGGVHLLDEAHVRPETLIAGLVASLRSRGVQIHEGRRVRRLHARRGLWTVDTTTGELVSDRVVIAAGVGSRELLRRVGVALPMQPARGYSMTSVGTGTPPRHVLYMPDVKVGCSPYDGEVRLVGTFELGADTAVVSAKSLDRVLSAWRRYLRDWRPVDPRVDWAGLRPTTPDSLPIMGEVPGCPGLFASAGHGMLGVTLAPASARLLAPAILEGRAGGLLDAFRLTRFRALASR